MQLSFINLSDLKPCASRLLSWLISTVMTRLLIPDHFCYMVLKCYVLVPAITMSCDVRSILYNIAS